MHAHVTCISCFSFSEDTDIRKNWKKKISLNEGDVPTTWKFCHTARFGLSNATSQKNSYTCRWCVTGQFSISFVSLSPNSWIIRDRRLQELCSARRDVHLIRGCILGDPGADSGCKRKSKRAEKYGTKKSKERREEPLGTMSYQTSSKRLPPSWLLIGARKLLCFSAQSEARRWWYLTFEKYCRLKEFNLKSNLTFNIMH